MTSVVIVDGGGNILEYVAGDEEAQQVKSALVQNTPSHIRIATCLKSTLKHFKEAQSVCFFPGGLS